MATAELQGLVPGVPVALWRLLDPRLGPLLPPLRSEIFGAQRFAEHGRSLGATHRAETERPGRHGAAFFPRLQDNIAMLRLAQRTIGQQAASGRELSPAAVWLLDNFHLIEAQLQAVREGLPRSYFRSLPVLMDPPLVGLPRVYGVAWAFVAHTDSAFDEELLETYLQAYQQTRELSLSEVWALPTTLRVVLIENLRRLAERLATHKAARELAHACCDRIETLGAPALARVLELLAPRGVGPIFVAQMALRLQARSAGPAPGPAVMQWLAQELPEAAAAQAQQNADQTSDNLSVGNALTALRAIGDADWPDIVAHSSALMQLMSSSALFESEHTSTRDQTLHGIEALARRSRRSELDVARALLLLMQPPCGGAATHTSVAGHWLDGPGRRTLHRALGLHDDLGLACRNALREARLALYLAGLVLGTTALVSSLLAQQPPDGWGLVTALLLVLPASEVVVALFHRLVSESVRPRPLPRLALAEGLGPAQRVLVAVPAMLTDTAGIDALVHRLQLHQLANTEAQTQFALLSDWADAPAASAPGDAALLAHAQQRIAALNAATPKDDPDAPPHFLLLHRERRFSVSEQAWIGWERKRGKLEQLIAALATGDTSAFVDLGPGSRPAPGTQHVLTLDSDTQLPPGRLRELLGVATHPQNRPRLAAGGHRLVGGHGILQPRIDTPLPAAGQATAYHRMFSGRGGTDPYGAASSEVYQDLFDEGSFSGKGLLHVATCHALLGGRLPPEQVLSHDLLEGALTRCATVSDITLLEEAPFHAGLAAARRHRWTRGDWQLLGLLLHSLGRPARWPMGGLNRWKLADNLRRSLVAPASMSLLLLALAGRGPPPAAALALVLAAYTAGPLLGALAGLLPSRRGTALRHFYRRAGAEVLRVGATGAWHVALLLHDAMAAADAIVRALWRSAVSRRRLLQWTTAAAAAAAQPQGLGAMLRLQAGVVAAALLLAVALAVAQATVGTPTPLLAALLCALWAATPLWLWWASRPLPAGTALNASERQYLHALARDTWRYFERTVTSEDRHLPPDNLQITPHEMLAHRSSPTNIGLYLLSTACAREFGWIKTEELLQRLEATLRTLQGLQRHRGHFLNWYDTQTGAALLPMYVSAVDSGNLCGHLLATAQACGEFALRADTDADADAARRLRSVAADCEALAWAPDFAFLYHRRRHLLHIGLRVAEQQLDTSFYDLLASESRMTSLLAIAKGDVPVRHWAALGRPAFAAGTRSGLRSWSGSMFEYLMPTLVLNERPGSVGAEAGAAALVEQQAYALEQHMPWGQSESAYAGWDHTLAYQYAPQGVPRLALRRTPADERVVAPYATVLAAQVDAAAARRNLATLQGLGARGDYGFIEALDYTPSRQAASTAAGRGTPVQTFMAHHQGMSIVALANVLLDGVAQRWGMAHPRIEAVATLLHERAPAEVPRLHQPPAAPTPRRERRAGARHRSVVPGLQALEPTMLMSNGNYAVALRANGAGHSRCGAVDISRQRDDALRDACGHFFFVRRGGTRHSLTQHPAPDARARYLATFHADRLCLEASWPDLLARITVWVSPEDDIEFRQLELHNLGDTTMSLTIESAFEPTLCATRADEAHPAFSNLFLQAEWRGAQQALVFQRRPRLAGEPGLHAAHFLAGPGDETPRVRAQASRAAWQGRNRCDALALGVTDPATDPATGAATDADTGTVPLATGLDPVCALSVPLRLAAGGSVTLHFATAASAQAETLSALIDKYRQQSHVARASLMSATLAGVRAQSQRLTPDETAAVQLLTTTLLLTLTRPPLPQAQPIDRRALWRLGLSGERPLLLVSAGLMSGLALLRALSQALRLWAWAGVEADLVVINAEAASYVMPLQREIAQLHVQHLAAGGSASSFLHLRADELNAAETAALQAVARVRFSADGRPLALHVQALAEAHERAAAQRGRSPVSALPPTAALAHEADATQGAFDADSGEFRFDVGAALRPQRPWINVLSNPGFGVQLSEAGGGNSWAGNSRLQQLTAWSNDAVADPVSEHFWLQDTRTHEVWSLSPGAWGGGDAAAAPYRVAHGQGYTAISHRRGDIEVVAVWCVDADLALRQVQVQVLNRGRRTLQLRLVAMAEWMVGARRADRASLHCAHQEPEQAAGAPFTALLATQLEVSAGLGGGTAFLAAAGTHDDWTCDRRELFDSAGHPVLPETFGRREGVGLDPCAALSMRLRVGAGESSEGVFLLGFGASAEAAMSLLAQAVVTPPARRLDSVRRRWDALLAASSVRTPDPLFDVLVNRWLLYQTVGCRLWAKAAFYQAGGATGFRDQLQDTLALAWPAPALLRAQIVLCASRQFEAGDVQHWWHEPGGAGVRTHFSDDLLWLPHALSHYLQTSGDSGVLDETVPFLEDVSIPEGAEDIYATPAVGSHLASIYEHAARAIDHSLAVGAHGLPLMGSGDWNDGMNRVGHQGRGESVWLGWFMCSVVAAWAPLARARGEEARAQAWDTAALGWRAALLQAPAWDGAWFARAFFDDGQTLGSQANAEARIDLIAQAWAVLSDVAPDAMQRSAMQSAHELLVDEDAGLVRLLDPPLQHSQPSPGYIQAYPPGVRENGGQYTHGAVWALMAQGARAQAGDPDAPARVWQYFKHLSPAHRAADATQGPAYGLEPYAVAGDVYSAPPYTGRGGWSWYTGAAGWLHRAALETIFGLRLQAETLSLQPCLPPHWPEAALTLRRGGRTMHFLLLRGDAAAAQPRAPQARLLQPGEALAWTTLAPDSSHVVPLPG